MFNLMPRDKTFFDELEQLGGHLLEAAKSLSRLVETFPDLDGHVQKIDGEEKAADDLAQQTLVHLDAAFITPLDREDIFHLITDLAGVASTMAGLARRFKLYKLGEIEPALRKQTDLLLKVITALNDMIRTLRRAASCQT